MMPIHESLLRRSISEKAIRREDTSGLSGISPERDMVGDVKSESSRISRAKVH